jgi:hypothetical protein
MMFMKQPNAFVDQQPNSSPLPSESSTIGKAVILTLPPQRSNQGIRCVRSGHARPSLPNLPRAKIPFRPVWYLRAVVASPIARSTFSAV